MKKILIINKELVLALLFSFVLFNLKTNAQDISKEQIIGEWKFVEVTLVSPKVGYIATLAKKEIAIMKVSMANYKFIEDGSIILPEKFLTKNGVRSGSWKLDGSIINITYFFKEGAEGHTNSSEVLPWSIISISEETLIIDLMGAFKVKLVK
jgi:hypothetical protein